MPYLSAPTAALAWLGILVIAVANGGFREAVLVPNLGPTLGTAMSGLLLIAAVCLVTTALLHWRPAKTTRYAAWVGFGWFVATVAFEFTFGAAVQGKPASEVLAAYTFQDGNIWPVILLAVLAAPYTVARLRQNKAAAARTDA